MRVAIALILLIAANAVIACPFAGLADTASHGRKLMQGGPGGGGGGGGGRPGGGGGGGPQGGGAGAQGGPQGGAQGGPQGGGQGGPQGGVQGGPQGGVQGGPQGGVQGGPQGGVQGGPQGGAGAQDGQVGPQGGAGGQGGNRPGGGGQGGNRPGGGGQGGPGAGAPGAGGPGGGRPGNGPPPTCNLDAAAIPASEPASQTATDAQVKGIALTYLATALRNNIPGFVRAAFHDPGTYNKAAGTGGANGSLLSPLESGNGDHRGLVPTINALIRFRNDINAQLPNGLQISAADVIQLAGGLAVEIAGGPSITASIPVGRVDSTGPDATNQLPAENDSYNVIACKFVNNGYSVAEMYALVSAHTLGVVNRNGNRVNLDSTPTLWDLAYWQQTQAGQSVLRSGRVMGTANPAIVSNYAGNQAAVNGDFAAAFVKMGKQGASWRSYGP